MNTYGVLDRNDSHIDVSSTERGAKNYATRNGYNKISVRYNNGYTTRQIAEKVNGVWRKRGLNY